MKRETELSESANTPSPTLGQRLLSALTTDQVETLLTAAAESGLLGDLDEKLRAADPDLADTVRRASRAEPAIASSVPVSDQKFLEIWNGLCSDWENCVCELGDAEGKYANHEEHWHPPYFDCIAFSNDLEDVAGQMRARLERAFPLVGQPDLFRDSVAEIEEGIQSFPDWMQPCEECCVLGPQATWCALHWTWLAHANEPSAGPLFADSLYTLGSEIETVTLETDSSVAFFSQLPEGPARNILAHLQSDVFKEVLADIRSVWHRIRKEYEKRFDPAAHLRTCAEHHGQNWRYGEPLIADALARGDLPQAEQFVEATLSSLLRVDLKEPWRPELGLLPENRYYRPQDETSALPKLLDQWADIAAKRGRAKRAAVCHLQRLLYEHPNDWPAVLEAFATFRDAGAPAVADELFSQWRERAVAACAGHASPPQKPTDTWFYWLIEARRDPSSNLPAFLEQTRLWLEGCLESAAFFGKHWPSLALLTRVLPQTPRLEVRCPTFNQQLLKSITNLEPKLLASLDEAQSFLGDATARLDPLPIWKKHLHTLVPTPGTAGGSNYRESAQWMKALSEVNRDAYSRLLARWKTEHKRRRNLWTDMASVQCPDL